MADTLQAFASAKAVNQTPRKLGIVAALVRGRSVADALVILAHTPKRAAGPVTKTIASARANALATASFDEKSLVIEQITVNHGPRLKRFRPAAMGRALPYQKRSSHISVVLSGELKARKPVVTKPSTRKIKEKT